MATTANWLEQWLSERGLFGRTQEQEPASSFQPMPMPSRQTGPLRFAQMPTESGEDTSSLMSPVSPMPPGITQEEARSQLLDVSGRTLSTIQDLKSILQGQQTKESEPTKGLFSGFDLDLGAIGEKISQGAKNIFESLDAPKPGDPITIMNAGPFGMMGRALSDPTLDTASKVGASIVGLGSMATSAFTPVSMLGTALNAMGAYHDFDPQFDKDITIDLDSGRVQWSGTDTPVSNPEDAARQTGGLAYYTPETIGNFIESVKEIAPETLITLQGGGLQTEWGVPEMEASAQGWVRDGHHIGLQFQSKNEPFDLSKMLGIDNVSKELKGLFEGFGDSAWGQKGQPGVVMEDYWGGPLGSGPTVTDTTIAGYANVPGIGMPVAVNALGQVVGGARGTPQEGTYNFGFTTTPAGQAAYETKVSNEFMDSIMDDFGGSGYGMDPDPSEDQGLEE